MTRLEMGQTGAELRAREAELPVVGETDPTDYNVQQWVALCRGEQVSSLSEEAKHTFIKVYSAQLQSSAVWTVQVGPSCPVPDRPCLLTTRADPYLQLGPLRRELICHAPRLELYHNLVGEREAALLAPGQEMQVYNKGEGLLTVLQAGTTAGTEAGQISGRSQAVGWRGDGERAGLATLAARTGRAVGLQVAEGGSELWQLGLYSPGGHFLPHWDAFKPDLLKANLPLR